MRGEQQGLSRRLGALEQRSRREVSDPLFPEAPSRGLADRGGGAPPRPPGLGGPAAAAAGPPFVGPLLGSANGAKAANAMVGALVGEPPGARRDRRFPEGPPRMGRSSHTLGDLLNLQGAGDVNTESVLLATLEALASLREGGRGRRRAAGGEEDPWMTCCGELTAGSSEGLRGLGSKGAAAVMRLNRAIEKEPEKWSRHVDEAAERSLGSDVSGLPWSMQEYGRQKLWSVVRNQAGLERMWSLFAHLHVLHRRRQHGLLGARLGQFLKAVEATAGILDSRPRSGGAGGLVHPAEFAAVVAFGRELRSMEDSLRAAPSSGARGHYGGGAAAASSDATRGGGSGSQSGGPKGGGNAGGAGGQLAGGEPGAQGKRP